MEHSDAQLAVAAGQGDVAAFGTLVDRLRGPLVAYLVALVGRQDEAEELAQEVLLRAWRHIGRLREPERVAAWVQRIGHNLAMTRRRAPRLVSLPDDPVAPDEAAPPESRAEAVAAAIAQLSEAHREVVWRKHFAGATQEQIAQQLGIPPGTVSSRLSRAYEELRRLLTDRLQA